MYSLIKKRIAGVMLPRQKALGIQKSCSVHKFWSVFIHASFLVHVPQVHPFVILLEFCARVGNSAKLSTISYLNTSNSAKVLKM